MVMAQLPAEPLVSVLVPCYNYARYIRAALDSLEAQSYSNFEVLVCDDGSSDDSCAIVQLYVDRDDRFHLIAKENGGVGVKKEHAFLERDLLVRGWLCRYQPRIPS